MTRDVPGRWPSSHYDAVVEGIHRIADTHLHVAIDLPGRLDAQHLRAALAAVTRDVPALGAVLEGGFLGTRWVAVPEPVWDVEERHGVDDDDAADAEAALFALPFEPRGALPVRLRLLHLPDRDRLLLRVSHMLADGGGTKNLCYRLASACAALAAGRVPPRRPGPPPHPLRRLLRAVRGRRFADLWASLLDEILLNRFTPAARVPCDASPRGTARFARLHLPAERVRRLRARAWPGRPTLNDLLCAAWARALASVQPPDAPARRIHLIVTSDLRQYEGGADDISNYSSLRPIDLGPLPPAPPAEHLAATMAATARWKRGGAGLPFALLALAAISPLPRRLVAWLIGSSLAAVTRVGLPAVALTNIGPIDAARLDFGAGPCLAARILAPLAHPPHLIAALTGCGGALDLSVAYRVPGHDPAAIAALLAAADREIEALS